MARFLLVLKPAAAVSASAVALIDGLRPVLEVLGADVEHRTPAHLSALLRHGADAMHLQLIAHAQVKAGDPALELALMSREPMGKGAPLTRAVFDQLVAACGQYLQPLEPCFRSDRDGVRPA